MPIELVCLGFSIVGGLVGILLFCLIWDMGYRSGPQYTGGGDLWTEPHDRNSDDP